MKVVSHTMEPRMERWSDPGDYPSAAGGAALKPYDYVAEIEGSIWVTMTPKEWDMLQKGHVDDWNEYLWDRLNEEIPAPERSSYSLQWKEVEGEDGTPLLEVWVEDLEA